MRLLLDTNILLWAVGSSRRMSAASRAVLEDPGNDVLFSAASIWEIAIKASSGRVDFPWQPKTVADAAMRIGFLELPITANVAAMVGTLPRYHRDPFDRLLVAQAIAEPARLYTSDAQLARYSDLVEVIA